MDRQLVFDISTLARSGGQAVGIVRVVTELARWAHAHRDEALFVIYDSKFETFRLVQPVYLEAILDGMVVVDASRQPDRNRTRPTLTDRLPHTLNGLTLWLRNPRRRAIALLEQHRLKGGAGATWAERIQSMLLGQKHRLELTDPGGHRRTMLPFDLVVGSVLVLNSKHLLLCPGSDWNLSVLDHVARCKASTNLRVAYICYDTVPLLHPEFYPPGSPERFRRMFDRIVALADLVFVTASQVAADVKQYCEANRLPVPRMRTIQLGADLVLRELDRSAGLPAGLEPGRYAIFVSTIEPRKGHRLLFSVWKNLVAQCVPQAAGFKLVFCGRRGWLVDDLLSEMEADPSYGSSLMILSGISDNGLAELYRNAAFGVFPSLYEGYGLPVVELFRHGKAVLSSTGGALRELVGEFSPLLDPLDENAWFEAMKVWIKDPAARAPYEAAIRERFSHPSWAEAAEAFFRALDELDDRPIPAPASS